MQIRKWLLVVFNIFKLDIFFLFYLLTATVEKDRQRCFADLAKTQSQISEDLNMRRFLQQSCNSGPEFLFLFICTITNNNVVGNSSRIGTVCHHWTFLFVYLVLEPLY